MLTPPFRLVKRDAKAANDGLIAAPAGRVPGTLATALDDQLERPFVWQWQIATSLLAVILSWKESLWCISVTAVSAGTLAVAIASFSNPEGCFWAKLPATSVASVALIMVFGWLTQRELARGLTFGGDQIRWTWPQPALMALAVKIERHRVDVNWLLPTSAFQCRAERGR